MKKRIDKEKKIVSAMIQLYCSRKHHHGQLCTECQELQYFAWKRLEECKYGNEKPSCRNCNIHCYRTEMQERIRQVMRFSGPRMIFYHPWLTLQYFRMK